MNKRITLLLLLFSLKSFSQAPDTKISSFFGLVHPIATYSRDGLVFNFRDSYSVGFAMAVVLKRKPNFGSSIEVVPMVKFQDGKSSVSNIVFHPGVTSYFKKGLTYTSRLAFDTSGRYGFTAIVGKRLWKTEYHSYNLSLINSYRFGNSKGPSVGLSLNTFVTF